MSSKRLHSTSLMAPDALVNGDAADAMRCPVGESPVAWRVARLVRLPEYWLDGDDRAWWTPGKPLHGSVLISLSSLSWSDLAVTSLARTAARRVASAQQQTTAAARTMAPTLDPTAIARVSAPLTSWPPGPGDG